jgi:trans-aconitate 2-methyltransferase
MVDWSPQRYLKFADERARPAMDLLARVGVAEPKLVYDLRCGPGNSTQLLVEAFPEAEVVGLDNSPAMLETARATRLHARFEAADISTWKADPAADLLFSNALFQWVPQHVDVLQHLLRGLKAGGILAVQLPDNLNEPSHSLMQEVALHPAWADRLKRAATKRSAVLSPLAYYEALKPLCSRVDIWHSIYTHPLERAQGIVDMFLSTGLRPFLADLTASEQGAFLDAYKQRIAEAYPAAFDGKVLLRFPRLFIVAVK